MKHDVELLRRSMDAAPADWLDRLVTERVVARVQRERTPQRTPRAAGVARVRRTRPALAGSLRAWLSRLVSPALQLLLWRSQRG